MEKLQFVHLLTQDPFERLCSSASWVVLFLGVCVSVCVYVCVCVCVCVCVFVCVDLIGNATTFPFFVVMLVRHLVAVNTKHMTFK